ncbi:hypothetical protein [Rufibacter tibetensis]|uniref:Uncharacterized protein n=1 Tax=Rufibacter tibetensis TaxID=512763 RepID=A0A0P0C5E3_9BACT|nr:hypothetical protein [Rufibacter tibetensis]ALI98462.1 hypothetical protein DC20_05055 [Rufibacter tibetensis]
MNHLFDRKTDSFFGALSYLGYVLFFAGIVVASLHWWWPGKYVDPTQTIATGALLVLLGFLFKYTYHGFQLDFQNRRVREYLSMFGLKTGKWAPLPAFKQILLTSTLRSSEDHDHDHGHPHSHDDEPAPPDMWYTIGLYSQSEEADYELRTDNAEDAHKTIQLLADRLGIPSENRTNSPASFR